MSWRKGIAEWTEGARACLSVVFSWDVPKAYARAVWLREEGYEVHVGGPGVFVFNPLVFKGVAQVGGTLPDVVTRHNPMATFASRGCPVGCSFCIVPAMEGRRFTFDEEVYERWTPLLEGPWRFAYDETGERDDVERVMRMLADEPGKRKRVYVLIGNEPVEACMDRIREVIAWGGEPHVQPEMKLKALRRRPWVKDGLDWSRQLLIDVARWANGRSRLWRTVPFEDYRRGVKKNRRR